MAPISQSHFHMQTFMFMILMISCKLCTSSLPPELCSPTSDEKAIAVYKRDIDLLQFAVNIEYLEVEWFNWGALGYGPEVIEPELALEGPPPRGARKANLDHLTNKLITEFGYQEIGHLRALNSAVGLIPRPLLDLSTENFAKIFDEAFGYELEPPFDPYENSLKYMLASYVIPYMGLLGYVGANPLINGFKSKRLLAGLLGVEAGQDAVIRMYLYERAEEVVHPYNHTVAEFTIRISELRNKLSMCGIKDEGLFVPPELGAEQRTSSNVLSANHDSLSYDRTPREILRTLYNTGNEHVPGGFYPKGGNGKIARDFLKKP